MTALYDPLNYENLAQSIVRALLDGAEQPLPPPAFPGPGVYAIYYRDALEYAPSVNPEAPIYVGKAVPPGARTGSSGVDAARDPALYRRLRDHEKSIRQAVNLEVERAYCRFLTVVPVWITLAERFLLDHYRPIWNTALDGFGNHDPGAGRRGSARAPWDIMHPGRPWASQHEASVTREDLIADIRRRLADQA